MKTTTLVLAIVTGVLLFSTILCGLWIRYSGEEITEGDLSFHTDIGIVMAIFALVTLVLAVIQGYRLSV